MASRQCMLAAELQNIGKENFDGLTANHQNIKISLVKILHYMVVMYVLF